MTVIITKDTPKVEFNKILKSFQENKKSKGVDTSKYCGVIKLAKDPLNIQKELRDEWR
jgi:hypothetical protein